MHVCTNDVRRILALYKAPFHLHCSLEPYKTDRPVPTHPGCAVGTLTTSTYGQGRVDHVEDMCRPQVDRPTQYYYYIYIRKY
jgi:hypothetical protein